MISSFFLLGLLLGVVLIAITANYTESYFKMEPLTKIKPWSKLCKLHSWKRFILLKKEEYEDYQKDPTKYPFINYCETCGYVPNKNMLLKPAFIEHFKKQEVAEAEANQRMKDIEELKVEFFKNAINQLPASRVPDVQLGFELYDNFIKYLPELVKKKELSRVLQTLGVKPLQAETDNVVQLAKNNSDFKDTLN